MMKQGRANSISNKMRGVIDPYTLGFLISLIGTGIVYAIHGDKLHSNETSVVTGVDNPSDSSTQVEDE